jgi:predicted transcriptional regulator
MKSGRDKDFSGKQPKDYNKLNVRYLSKLTTKKLIKVEEKTRGEISLTEDGKLAVNVFSVYYDVNLNEIKTVFKKIKN